MPKSKNKVAYQVNEECEGHSCVVFHHHGLAARREGASELGEDFESVTCFRVPHFDKFAEQGFVPVIELLKGGWWFECRHCGNRIMDDEGTPRDEVVAGVDYAYCDQKCKNGYDEEVASHNAKFEEFKRLLVKQRPDLEFTKFSGEWPQLTLAASFRFDGCQYGGSVQDQRAKGDIKWYVSNCDKEAWDKYEESRIKPA